MENNLLFLNGGGESGELVRACAWQETTVGDPATWPECIKTAISICLNSSLPCAVYLGDDFILINNDAYQAVTGDKHDWKIGKPRHEAWPEVWKQTKASFESVIALGRTVKSTDELFLLNRFGFVEQRYFNYSLSPIIDADGQAQGLFSSMQETTDAVLASRRAALIQQFKARSSQFSTLEAAFQEVLLPLANGPLDIPFSALYGFSADRPESLKFVAGDIPAENRELQAFLIEVTNTEVPLIFEYQDKRWYLVPLKQGEHGLHGIFAAGLNKQLFFDDVYRQFLENIGFLISTALSNALGFERNRQVSEQIKYQEDQFQNAIEVAGLATWDFDVITQTYSGNSRYYNWFGYPEGQPLNFGQVLSRIDPADHKRINYALQYVLDHKNGGSYGLEYTILNPEDGSARLVKTTGQALFNKNNEVIRFTGTLQDITSERQMLAVLEETNNRLEIALEAGRLGSYELEPGTGKMVYTAQFLANLGRNSDEAFNYQDLFRQILPEYHQLVHETIQTSIQDNQIYEVEYEVRWSDGSLHWIKAYGKPHYEAGKIKKMVGVIQDVTENITARKELERAYEQARLAREAAQIGTFDHDLIHRSMEWDERCRLMFGITHTRPLNMERDLIGGIHPEDRKRMKEIIRYTLDSEQSDGHYDVEYRTIGVEDAKTRWVRAKGRVFFNEFRIPVRFIGAILEITDQKENEIRKNDFISMVSHELKTPLTSLKAHVQILNRRAKLNHDQYSSAALDKVEVQIRKMSTMIHSFLSLDRLASGQIHLDKTSFVLNDLIQTQKEDMVVLSNHRLFFEPCPVVTVYADFEKLGQVLTNLISNAIKYSPQGGIIEIGCSSTGQEATVFVKDRGIGIAEADMKYLFDRFYRVEGKFAQQISGFGIGLYLSAEIIRLHEGKIWAESKRGEGSTFYFSIPLKAI